MDNVDKMEAGRELDALVAEKVMGWKWPDDRCPICGWKYEVSVDKGCVPDNCSLRPAPEIRECDKYGAYSTDIAAAWKVVEKLVNSGWCVGLLFDDNGHWALATDGTQNVPLGDGPEDIATTFFIEKELWCDTAPLAICRAALKAVGYG